MKHLSVVNIKSYTVSEALVVASVGYGLGYLASFISIGVKNPLLRKLLGATIQFCVTTYVWQHPKAILSLGHELITQIQSMVVDERRKRRMKEMYKKGLFQYQFKDQKV